MPANSFEMVVLGNVNRRSSSRTTRALDLLPVSSSNPFPQAWIGIVFATKRSCLTITNDFIVGGGVTTLSQEDRFAIVDRTLSTWFIWRWAGRTSRPPVLNPPRKRKTTGIAVSDWYYPDGTVIRLESTDGPAFGGIFIGQQGKIEINRGRFACNPKNLLAPFTGSQTESHVANWLDCIETREQPNAPVEVGHLIASVAHLINTCRITGTHDQLGRGPKSRSSAMMTANAVLTKERRPEFSLPSV